MGRAQDLVTLHMAFEYSLASTARFLLPEIIRNDLGGTSAKFIYTRINRKTYRRQWKTRISIPQALN